MKPKGILIILGIVFLVFALTTCFLILKIQRASEIQRAKVQEKKEVAEIAPGKHVFEIITDNPRDPQIIEVEIDPLDVKVGETQVVRVKIKTLADSVKAEDFVLGKAICDEKEFEFPFKLKKVEGKEELITTWEGKWEREKECTFEKNHQIKIFAKNIKGEDEVTLSLGSSCPTPTDGQNYVLSTTTVGSSGCIFSWNVNGVENGNIIVESGFTLTVGGTIAGGQTIVFNPGYSITINGRIALNKTSGYQGQIKKAYICAKNSDGDNNYAYGVDSSSACGNFGGSRRYTLASLTDPDCDDTNGFIYRKIDNLSKDGDRDGYLNPTPQTGTYCVGDSTTTATRTYYKDSAGNYSWLLDSQKLGTNDCDDSNNLVWTYGYGIDNDGDNYGQSSYGCNNGASPRTATAGTDCDDNNSAAWVWKYKDEDGDGYCYDKNGNRQLDSGDAYCVGNQSGYVNLTSCSYYSDGTGYDCCDIPSDAGKSYSKQTSFFTTTNACGSWDYDCNGTTTQDSSTCTGYSACTCTGATQCYFLLDECTAGDIYYTSCSLTSYTASCGETWTSYSRHTNSLCYTSTCSSRSTKYLCTSQSTTCGCR